MNENETSAPVQPAQDAPSTPLAVPIEAAPAAPAEGAPVSVHSEPAEATSSVLIAAGDEETKSEVGMMVAPKPVPDILKLVLLEAPRHAEVGYIRPYDVVFVCRRGNVTILSLTNGVSIETVDEDGSVLALFVPEEYR
jgi:hypothetical protein